MLLQSLSRSMSELPGQSGLALPPPNVRVVPKADMRTMFKGTLCMRPQTLFRLIHGRCSLRVIGGYPSGSPALARAETSRSTMDMSL